VKILRFYVNGQKGATMTPEFGEDMRQANAAHDGAWTTDLQNIEVSPRPKEAGIQYQASVALRPTETATQIPDRIANEYAMVIADGALGRLLRINGATWANPAEADVSWNRFTHEAAKAASRVARGYSRAPRSVKAFSF
jgi:hypothetical protein